MLNFEMLNLQELYDKGIDYDEYIKGCSEEDRQKHLHYLNKLELDAAEAEKLKNIKAQVKLLVFCNTTCNDCRITLALLENIKKSASLVSYRIVGREGHEELMKSLSGDSRIPLIINLKADAAGVVFNERPDILREKIIGLDEEKVQSVKNDFRRGLYKQEMLEQLLNRIM